MPRKKKGVQQKQKQKQSQRVVVNVGTITKSKPRKRSGRGGLPPPSHMHNLAPTFVTAPQVDYTPILAMIQHHARPIVAQAPMPITQTPLSASLHASSAEQMAGEAAIRRAGPTASSFQPPPSQADERLSGFDDLEGLSVPAMVRPPDPIVTERLVKPDEPQMPIGAEARAKPGRPFKPENITIGEPVTGDFIPARIRQSTKELGEAGEVLYRSLSEQQRALQEPITTRKPRRTMTDEEKAQRRAKRAEKAAKQASEGV